MDVKQFYETINGNYSKALETMMSEDFVKRMLLKFLDSSIYNDLLEVTNNKDIVGIFNATHMLKGVAGNLSLTPLQEKASRVCEMVRHPSNDLPNLDKELDELLKLYQSINNNLALLR